MTKYRVTYFRKLHEGDIELTAKERISNMWNDSFNVDKFWISFFSMIIHPKESLRLINFAIKVLKKYEIQYEAIK